MEKETKTMAENIISDPEEALKNLDSCVSDLSPDKRRCIFESIADFIAAQFTPVDFLVERRPRSPLRPTAEEVQTVVNRLREKAKGK